MILLLHTIWEDWLIIVVAKTKMNIFDCEAVGKKFPTRYFFQNILSKYIIIRELLH